MRILYIVPRWPNMYTTYIFCDMAFIKRRGHQVFVASLRDDATGGEAQLKAFGLLDVPVLQLAMERGPASRLVREALAFARANAIEMTLAEGARPEADLAYQLRREASIPYVVRMHGGDVHYAPAANLQELVDGASAVCPVSPFLADILVGKSKKRKKINKRIEKKISVEPTRSVLPIDVPAEKLRVLPNSLPNDWIASAPAPQQIGPPILGTIGRVAPIKGHGDLIDAVAALSGDFPDLRLRIIGDGDLRGHLVERAAALGVLDRVEITGAKPWPTVMRLADDLHIYVQASYLEGFCMATIEGAARGLPVVASRTGIHDRCVEHGVNGYLFDVDDTAALRRHLRTLLSAGPEARRRMGAASIAVVRERFVVENLGPRAEAVYKAVIAGAPLPK